MISGFMIVKDVLKTGYPFAEAIASALPICDEFLISDGHSTDGTFEVLQQISKINKKVKVFRQEWPPVKNLSVLGEVTNVLRRKCRFNYIFSVQANEIVHEESTEFIKALPEMCPGVQTFSFPYLHLMCNHKFSEEFRLRFSMNLPSIIAVGDAWSLGSSHNFIINEALRSLRNPRKFMRYVARGVEWTYANTGGHVFTRAVNLPKPVFRYWSLFPLNFLEKAAKHAEMFRYPGFYETIAILKNQVDDPSLFWEKAADMWRTGPLGFNYPKAFGIARPQDHPKLIQDFVSNQHLSHYYVRDEVLQQIKEL